MRAIDRRTIVTFSCALVAWLIVASSIAGYRPFRHRIGAILIGRHIGAITFHARLWNEAALSTYKRNGRYTLLGKAAGLRELPESDASDDDWVDALASANDDELTSCGSGIAEGYAETLADLKMADAASPEMVAALDAVTQANQRLAAATCQLAGDAVAGARDLREYGGRTPGASGSTEPLAQLVRDDAEQVRVSMAVLRAAARDADAASAALMAARPALFGDRTFGNSVDCLGASAIAFATVLDRATVFDADAPQPRREDKRTPAERVRDVYFCPGAP